MSVTLQGPLQLWSLLSLVGPNPISWIDGIMNIIDDTVLTLTVDKGFKEFGNMEYEDALKFATANKVEKQNIQLKDNKFRVPYSIITIKNDSKSSFTIDTSTKAIVEMDFALTDVRPKKQNGPITFPNTLIRLKISDNSSVENLVLPKSLKRLEFCDAFNQPIDTLNFKELTSLTEMQFGDEGDYKVRRSTFNHPIRCLLNLPNKLLFFKFHVIMSLNIRDSIDAKLMAPGAHVLINGISYKLVEYKPMPMFTFDL